MEVSPKQQPGDRILDRYAPDLSPKEREAAREKLQAVARLIIRIETRLAREATNTLDSRESEESGRIQPTTTSSP